MDISFSNEYSYEINRIIEELLKNITIQNLSKEINKVFKNAYNGLYKIEKMKKQKQQKKFLKNITIYLNYKFKKIIKKFRIADKKAIKNGKQQNYRGKSLENRTKNDS